MSNRTSLDQYQIPLRLLGRGRRKPVRTFSTSSNTGNGDLEGAFAETADEDEDRLSTDEAPLIRKHEVCPMVLYSSYGHSTWTLVSKPQYGRQKVSPGLVAETGIGLAI